MMAPAPYHYRRPVPVAAVTLSWRGTARTLKIGRATAFALFGVLPILAVWYLGATAYLVFHDQLLASLISRQADTQYAYEDRIAALKTQLDRQTSRALVDRQTLATTIRDLSARSMRLEAHAVTIDEVLNGLGPHGIDKARNTKAAAASDDPLLSMTLPSPDSAGDPPALSFPRADRDDQGRATDIEAGENHSELLPEAEGSRLAETLDAVATRQSAQIARLRDPMIRAVDRLQTALAETGLPLSRLDRSRPQGDVGGPFVPLPDDARGLSFEQNIALLQDAMVQHARLAGIADGVPLRRPLEGQIAVTSPFGARLDPFFGRPAMHTGMDLMEAYGGPVMATAKGTVTIAGSEGGYGNMVEIDHGNGLVTRYAHLASIEVVPHQKVLAGTIVGRVGSTGRATGPHLHYETRIDGEPVDPSRFLRAGALLFR
jgi:murein DD-endopeptidase MepM/ murein hydrolase activator NlpD